MRSRKTRSGLDAAAGHSFIRGPRVGHKRLGRKVSHLVETPKAKGVWWASLKWLVLQGPASWYKEGVGSVDGGEWEGRSTGFCKGMEIESSYICNPCAEKILSLHSSPRPDSPSCFTVKLVFQNCYGLDQKCPPKGHVLKVGLLLPGF